MTAAVYETPAQTETRLLTQIAGEYNTHVSAAQTPANGSLTWADLRWWIIGSPPRAVAIVTRGKIATQVKTVSKTNTPDLWESWQPVIREWLAERANGKRQNHDKLTAGKI